MSHPAEPSILGRLSTPYLQALGELSICARRLHRRREGHGGDPAWSREADHLLSLNDALSARLGVGPLVEHSIAIEDADGTFVPADVEFVRHLVDRIVRHLDHAAPES
ncbi:hypothetical protein GCM10009840_10780 [Pseudolysinimonas kribbensis]|uniref:Uncharacterized protein n=1 Tax=Pseudolysinimonas kribbensis TaxID=433641 RepID=A0ABQ6K4E4_9MICO|nr:hypothetical protein [Pseudolysinimonas kribbensis]GMA95501.1 hypothetical protein GCM10025881_23250 [Pseudolysinimonas kribbensis]